VGVQFCQSHSPSPFRRLKDVSQPLVQEHVEEALCIDSNTLAQQGRAALQVFATANAKRLCPSQPQPRYRQRFGFHH
jgi:hypothetical protein